MSKYAIGIDFGTLSARALVAEIGTGRELGAASMDYPHAVMNTALPDGTPLPPDWALQHPQDYIDCLSAVIPAAIEQSGVDRADIIALGVDCTACTLIPVDASGTPLCFYPEYASNPHAYAKLWKHHASQKQANHITEVARARGESFLARYGGRVSSEWMLPKVLQMLEEDPVLYAATDRFIEAGDWIVFQLTGNECRAACAAGYKAFWHKRDGYPSDAFFQAVHPGLAGFTSHKIRGNVYPAGWKAGEITGSAARLTTLLPGTAVAVANVDAHVSMPPTGLTQPGDMLMIMGTSSCHVMLGDKERAVPGMCGVVEDGLIPGLMGYEAGQSCVGDLFGWFVDNCVPAAYAREAAANGAGLHQLLTQKAQALRAGQSGLIALDWWNGNRSVLVDVDLTGMLVGMTLLTRPEEIYRALIEATAFGTRTIFNTFEQSGLAIRRLYACGGISRKNPFIMQVYADVLGREIRVARSRQNSALGSAMFGAVAAGPARGGYGSIEQAAQEMGGAVESVYRPDGRNHEIYSLLYAEYKRLHDYFGRGADSPIKQLKQIRVQSAQPSSGA